MTTLQSDFLDGSQRFEEAPAKHPGVKRLQGAMFLDRPDLWPSKKRRQRKAAQEQLRITKSGEEDE